jgi:hypothetical protein
MVVWLLIFAVVVVVRASGGSSGSGSDIECMAGWKSIVAVVAAAEVAVVVVWVRVVVSAPAVV